MNAGFPGGFPLGNPGLNRELHQVPFDILPSKGVPYPDNIEILVAPVRIRERRQLEGGSSIVRRKRTNEASWREGRKEMRCRKRLSSLGRDWDFTRGEKRESERSPARVWRKQREEEANDSV